MDACAHGIGFLAGRDIRRQRIQQALGFVERAGAREGIGQIDTGGIVVGVGLDELAQHRDGRWQVAVE